MKNSGVEWIGEIPDDWEVSKTKYLTKLYTGNSIKDEEKDLYEDKADAIPYISSKDINAIFSTTNYENGMYVKHSDNSFVRAPAGSTLMCIEGGSAGKKKTFLNQEVCFVNKLCCFSPIKIDNKFLFYCLNSPNYEEEFRFNISGMIGGVSVGKLNQFILPKPPKSTQQRIASYLDKKCSKIEETIQNQQQVIEKLKAYKQSLITEAVTGKIKIENGKACGEYESYKDSGVEWIGKIPSGWEVIKAKYFIKISNGSDPKTEEGDTPVYGSGAESFKTCVEFKEGPTVLIGRKGATLHIPHYIAGNYWNVDTAFDVKTYSEEIFLLKFYYYCATAFDYRFYLTSTTLPSMTQTNYGNMYLPVPNTLVQKEIVEFLDNKYNAIDTAIEQKQKLIVKLTEYKKSLIYECVTGKKEI